MHIPIYGADRNHGEDFGNMLLQYPEFILWHMSSKDTLAKIWKDSHKALHWAQREDKATSGSTGTYLFSKNYKSCPKCLITDPAFLSRGCAQLLSHVRLCGTPWTVARQAPLSLGILQATIIEWVAVPSSKCSSQPRDRTLVSGTAGGFCTVWATRGAHSVLPIWS